MSIAEIDALKQQQTAIYEQINAIHQGQATGDVQALQNELNAVSNKISELEYTKKLQAQTAEIEAQHETLVEETKAKTAYLLDTLEIEGLSISQLSASAEAYDILRQGLQQFIDKKDAAMLEQLKIVKEETAKSISEIHKQNDALNEALQVKTDQYNALKNEYNAIVEENKDNASKRDAAAKELEEANAEIDRLNSQVQDLRTEIAIGAKAATQVVNTSEDLAAKAEAYKKKLEESRIPIYNLRWEDPIKKDYYLAEKAETDETIRFNWMEKTKYKEVTAEQADTFRAEYLAKQEAEHVGTDSNGTVEMEEHPVTVPAFREEAAESTEPGLAEGTPSVAGTTVTREEFESLKSRVAALESFKIGNTTGVGEVA